MEVVGHDSSFKSEAGHRVCLEREGGRNVHEGLIELDRARFKNVL